MEPSKLKTNATFEPITRALVEGTDGACYGFVSEGTLMCVQMQTSSGLHEAVKDERTFESWREL